MFSHPKQIKFLCLDFDNTLTQPVFIEKIKSVLARLKANNRTDINIGIITSRAIYSDLMNRYTPGERYQLAQPDIRDLLEKHQLEFDFICTAHTLYLSPFKATQKMIPVSKEVIDYLGFRDTHRNRINELNNFFAAGMTEAVNFIHEELENSLFDLRQKESELFNRDFMPFFQKAGSTKIMQLYRLHHALGDGDVLMVDDLAEECDSINRRAENHQGSVLPKWTALRYFKGIEQEPDKLQALFAQLDAFILPSVNQQNGPKVPLEWYHKLIFDEANIKEITQMKTAPAFD